MSDCQVSTCFKPVVHERCQCSRTEREPPLEEPLKYKRNGFVWNQDDPRTVAMIREKERYASKIKDK